MLSALGRRKELWSCNVWLAFIGSSLKFRFLLLAASVALLVFGIEQLQKMPVDVFPEFAPP